MSIHTYKCQTCGKIFDRITRPGTRIEYCDCGKIAIREGIELCSPAKLIAGIGGFEKPSYSTRERE